MPIKDLNIGPINPNELQYQDVLKDLQGNILKGHGRDKSVHIFLTFFPPINRGPIRGDDIKKWISRLASGAITSAQKQLDEAKAWKEKQINGDTFVHFALSSSGYTKLNFPISMQPQGVNLRKRESGEPGYTQAFQKGMKQRQNALLDPPVTNWDVNFQQEIDAVIILANDDSEILQQYCSKILKSLEGIVANIFVEQGDALRKDFNGKKMAVEHFGYADGISQPIFLRENEQPVNSLFDAPLSLVLVPDPFGEPGVSFGSFFVFRKLEQNVQGFKKAELALAQALGIPEKLAGAMAVGRFENGTPLVLQPDDDSPALNNFDYSGDPKGMRCPFHAHIRKSNPRLESVGSFAQSREEELGHRIARRGVTYGGPLSEFDQDLNRLPKRGVGLLFMCYQSDIWEQFEFMQRLWCNNPIFLVPGINDVNKNPFYDRTGLDAVVGQRQGKQQDPLIGEAPEPPKNWPASYGQPAIKPDIAPENQFGQFVTLRGGEYFFSPSISFLQNLHQIGFIVEDRIPVPDSPPA